MNEQGYIMCLMGFWIGWSLRRAFINGFKIAYYEKKLENRGVDIGHIKNISLSGIRKL